MAQLAAATDREPVDAAQIAVTIGGALLVVAVLAFFFGPGRRS